MPPDMVRDWVAKDGTARIQVFPKDTSGSNASLNAFSKAVMKVAPGATGAPISIRQSGTTIVNAFIEAGLLSFIVITLLLIVVLRRVRDVMLTIIPLVLTGLLTLATAVAIGLQLNFANVIALPLLFGIGVAFNIYFVMAWRAGQTNLLQSSLTRAVIFSALTTASGFGSLWLSSHPGTASMGELLMISLGWTLATTLFFLPALMGPPQPRTSGSLTLQRLVGQGVDLLHQRRRAAAFHRGGEVGAVDGELADRAVEQDVDDLPAAAELAHAIDEGHGLVLGDQFGFHIVVGAADIDFGIDGEFLAVEAVEVAGILRDGHAPEGFGEGLLVVGRCRVPSRGRRHI